LQADAGVNFGLPETPLIAAAAAGLTDFVKRLLEAGANANTPDDVSFVLTLSLFIVSFEELLCYVLSFILSK
jgi:hypothetical protein